jgi:hypothetical protein
MIQIKKNMNIMDVPCLPTGRQQTNNLTKICTDETFYSEPPLPFLFPDSVLPDWSTGHFPNKSNA